MKRITYAALAGASLIFASPAAASQSDWAKASDIGRDGLMIAALGLPAVQGDLVGTGQAALALGSTRLVTDAIKETIPKERPDGSNDRSFISGHTSMSFAAAASLHKRNGWQVGLPAHAVAAFVGLARVKADKHFVEDVIIGAAVGEAAGWLLATRKNSKVQWVPWGDSRSAGATVGMRF